MSVVDIDLARQHLNVIGTDQDEIIQQCLDAAEGYASDYMNRPLEPWVPPDSSSGSEPPLPKSVVQAVLLLMADFYENREAQVVGVAIAENTAAHRLLHFHRRCLGV
ncbi:head-tail connector protein [Chitiniphilus eburneus]|uniref:head-tail connector protein n=1 Tax=Chitiniphilus eburneus TaxID=2571148 RepID=UPI0035CE8DEC